MIIPVVQFGSSVLRKKATDITAADDAERISTDLFHTLYKYSGIGLAGPQISLSRNIFVIDTSPLTGNDKSGLKRVFINPEIIRFGEETAYYTEGCLSLPGIFDDLLRPAVVEVRYYDIRMDKHEETLDGIIARIFLHEYDHLRGVLFIDRLGLLKREQIRERISRASWKVTP